MPAHARGELAVDVEAVVREQHDELRALAPRLLDIGAHVVLADAERPGRDHPARIGDRRVGKRLPEHGDLHAALLEQLVGVEHRLLPFGVADVLREEREAETVGQFLHPVGAVGELPVAGHGVGLQQLEAVGHVLARGAVRAERALPGVAAVEQQHLVVAALRARRLHGGGEPVEPADAAVALRQRREILRGQRIGGGRLFRNAEARQEVLAGDVRRLPLRLADADDWPTARGNAPASVARARR